MAFMANTKPIEKDDVLNHLDQVLAKKTESHDMDTMKKWIKCYGQEDEGRERGGSRVSETNN